ncbi:TetR/AcrR family transcriptional regulator [Conyzicola sp.]|uniref:TetR/AcrR family transcriptional regulator n=1 Tax=Conyzicola sp. TaxID=1969404 RepID=UPI00398A4A38
MDDTPPRSYAKGVARRKEILERTIEVFAEKGAAGTSLRAIGEAIGVSHGALLHYFSSREELLVEVLRENAARFDDDYQKAGDGLLDGMLSAAERNVTIPGLVALYSTMMGASVEPGNETSRRYFAHRFAGLRAELVEQVVAAQTAGAIRADVSPESVAALVIAASDGLQVQWLLDPSVEITAGLEVLQTMLAVPTAR